MLRILRNVGDVMNVSVYYPNFTYSETHQGSITIREFRKDNGKIILNKPTFMVPNMYPSNELAATGYFAHELAHARLLFDKRHKVYTWMKERIGEEMNSFFLIPGLAMYVIEERRVDRLACSFGFTEEIKELRKYGKWGVELIFTDD